MPTPPNIDEMDKVSFIVNYALVGCTVPFYLMVQLSREPLTELVLLLLIPDIEDIVQEVLSPMGGRGRESGRHGRKSPSAKQKKRRLKFPDTSEIVGQKIRGKLNPHNALQFKGFRYAFRIINVVEGVEITAAVLSKLTDTVFDPLWGILSFSRNNCREFYRIGKTKSDAQLIGGPGNANRPYAIDHVEMNVGFADETLFTGTDEGDWNISVRTVVYNPDPTDDITVRPRLRNLQTGQVFEGFEQTVGPKDTASLNVHGDAAGGQDLAWEIRIEVGFALVIAAELLAFRDSHLW